MPRAVRQRESEMMAYQVRRLEISGSAWAKRSKNKAQGLRGGGGRAARGQCGVGWGVPAVGRRRELSSASVRPSSPSPQAIIPTLCQELGERVPFPVGQCQGHRRHRRGQTEQDNSQKQKLREEVSRDT